MPYLTPEKLTTFIFMVLDMAYSNVSFKTGCECILPTEMQDILINKTHLCYINGSHSDNTEPCL